MGVKRIDPHNPLFSGVKARLADLSEHDEFALLRDAVQALNNVVLVTDPKLPDNPIISTAARVLTWKGYRSPGGS